MKVLVIGSFVFWKSYFNVYAAVVNTEVVWNS